MIGFHLGNEGPITDQDRQIMAMVPPACVCFLPGQSIPAKNERGWLGIQGLLAMYPWLHVHMRPYFAPSRATDPGEPQRYIDDCKRFMDDFGAVIPVGQRHLQPWNEQNQPRRPECWEGFGDQLDDMRRFDDWFCQLYWALKGHDSTWRIGWTPLTPGNRDVWFAGDAVGHYYMHGPEGCTASPNVAQAIASGPCRASLALADEYYAHIYLHDAPDAWKNPAYGGRHTRLAKFLPKAMDIWILEAGFPGRVHLDAPWAMDALIAWLGTLSASPRVRSAALWMLGTNWGSMWYPNGTIRPELQKLKAWAAGQGSAPDAPAMPGPQPPQSGFSEAWLAEARKQKVRFNPNAALSVAISAAGQLPLAQEWIDAGVTYQWGLDLGRLMWHLWSWMAAGGVKRVYSEPVKT